MSEGAREMSQAWGALEEGGQEHPSPLGLQRNWQLPVPARARRGSLFYPCTGRCWGQMDTVPHLGLKLVW